MAKASDPKISAIDQERQNHAERLEFLRAEVRAQLEAAKDISDPEFRERFIARGKAALKDPLADLAKASRAFSTLSAASVRREMSIEDKNLRA